MAESEESVQKSGSAAAKPDARAGGGFWEQVTTLVIAVLIALFVRQFIIEPFRIPSGSMFRTLLIGDHLFVNKFVYGAKLPFSDIRLPGLREPERGEVVVFTVARRGPDTFPADRKPNLPTEEFIKRIIGVPGDEIDHRGGTFYINGTAIESEPLDEIFETPEGERLDVSRVSLGSREFETLDHSKDSRVWGTVRKEELKGPAFILYWSWNFKGSWIEVINPKTWWDVEKRWDRIGQLVN